MNIQLFAVLSSTIIILGVSCSASAQICPGWTNVNPIPRRSMAIAYDSRRGVTVVFGGYAPGGDSKRDTYEWNGSEWSLRASGGPPRDSSTQMVYDSARGVCVLLSEGETWEWDGQSWLKRDAGPSNPFSVRTRFGLAYDEARQCTVMFGGEPYSSSEKPTDTWTWDGQQWRQIATIGPPGRAYPMMAFDPVRQRVVLFGGGDLSNPLGDTWEFDGSTWMPKPFKGAPARTWAAMTYCHALQKVVLVGGYRASPLRYDKESWAWDGQAWTRLFLTGMSPRAQHGVVDDSKRGVLVCFGGTNGDKTYGDVLECAIGNPAIENPWILKHDRTPPSPRRGAAAAYDSRRGVIVLFGGTTGSGGNIQRSGETWEWDGQRWWFRTMTGPSPRSSAAMCYDRDRGVTVLHGGITGISQSTWQPDTWEWDGVSWTLRSTFGAARRGEMVYDEARHVSLYFGTVGNGVPQSSDTLAWNGISWTTLSLSGPAPRTNAAMAYDPDRQVVVLHGGWSGNASLSDTWEWNGTVWLQRQQNSSFARSLHGMAFDRRERRMIGWGGSANPAPYVGTCWMWDPRLSAWEMIEDGADVVRYDFVMQYDEARGKILRFGGFLSDETQEFEFRAPPDIRHPPRDFVAFKGLWASFRATPFGGNTPEYQWRRNGVPLQDGDGISGSNAEILLYDHVDFGDAGTFDAIVRNECGETITPTAVLSVRQPGDVNGDMLVRIDDLLAVIAAWGPCPNNGEDCPEDFGPWYGDRMVDANDLLIVILNWSV